MEITRDAAGVPQKIVMKKPWNAHTHVRTGAILYLVAPMLAKQYWGAVIMPNTDPPITTWAMASQYRGAIQRVLDDHSSIAGDDTGFEPAMTFYLTDELDATELYLAAHQGIPVLLKYYPRGLTTNSDKGVTDPSALWTKETKPWRAIRTVAECGGTLMLHAADAVDTHGVELDPYDQERHFLLETLPRIFGGHDVRISVEHLSTATGCEEMRKHGAAGYFGCSVTPHHLLLDRRDVFRGGMRPHNHCWPVVQPVEHTQELRKLVAERHPFVFLGDDSAPHPVGRKECECAAGGLFVAHASIELYAEAFEDMGSLDALEDFASTFGPAFHGLPPVKRPEYVTLVREPWQVANRYSYGTGNDEWIRPMRAGEEIRWKLVQN